MYIWVGGSGTGCMDGWMDGWMDAKDGRYPYD